MKKATRTEQTNSAAREHMQTAINAILVAVANGEIDLNQLAREELASRGLGRNGEWLGFEAARKLHLTEKTNATLNCIPTNSAVRRAR